MLFFKILLILALLLLPALGRSIEFYGPPAKNFPDVVVTTSSTNSSKYTGVIYVPALEIKGDLNIWTLYGP